MAISLTLGCIATNKKFQMKFPDSFLDELRNILPVSAIVGRRFTLIKQGSEHVAKEDKSISVNDQKKLWWDFGKGQGGGDIFAFLQAHESLSFPQAVEVCAQLAGVALPSGSGDQGSGASNRKRDQVGIGNSGAADRKKRREIVATYDYTDAQGYLIYQVVRFDPKGFAQRRPNPEESGTWIWGLDVRDADNEPLEFMRKERGRDWSRFDEKKFTEWKYNERRTFLDLENVPHGLENYQELAAELELPDDRRTFHICEGEKDRHTLSQWGFLATTNSGGAKHWSERLAKLFADADVIIHQHNDVAGRERIAKMAPMLLNVGARVRVCDPGRFWDGCPEKGDITDWRDKAGGTAERLYEIIDTPLLVPDWKPEPYRSKLGAIRWRDQRATDRPRYEWTIQGLVPRRRTVLIYGESQSGKSFETYDIAMSVVRGIEFAGRRTRRGGVIYVAAEKGAGFVNRMIAYKQYHGISDDDDLPFAVLTRRINLWMDAKMIELLAQECKAIAAEWNVPLEAIVIDTHNAATSGASEIKSEDVTVIKDRYEDLIEKTGAGVWIIHHKNAQGGLRGSLILYNAMETAIEIYLVIDKHSGAIKDDNGHLIRRAHVRKQSEGPANDTWDFVLKQIIVGKDEYGENETSCVTEPPARPPTQEEAKDEKRADRSGAGFHLNKSEAAFFSAMLQTIKQSGVPPAASLNLPLSVARVALWNDFTRAYRAQSPNTEGTSESEEKQYKNRIRKSIERARETLLNYKLIGVGQLATSEDGAAGQHVIWPTGRPVWGPGITWPPPKPKPAEPQPIIDQATGQEITGDDYF